MRGMVSGATTSILTIDLCMFSKLFCLTTNVVPRRLRVDEYVHLDLDTRVAFDAPQCQTMNVSVMKSTNSRATLRAKSHTPSLPRLVDRKMVLAREPFQRTRG